MRATVTTQVTLDRRHQRRLRGMRRIQNAALDLFEARGFDRVTIEQVALAAEVSAPTVYRSFGNKEQLVLWDDYDPMLLQQIGQRLPARSLRKAVLESLIACLNEIYGTERIRILRRSRLILAQPSLRAASSAQLADLKRALADLFLIRRACQTKLEAEVTAGGVVAVLDSGVHHWVREKGRRPLEDVLREAFAHLAAF